MGLFLRVTAASLVLVLGACKSSDGGSVGDQFTEKLQSCGFLTPGEVRSQPEGSGPAYEFDNCLSRCVIELTCDELGDVYCGTEAGDTLRVQCFEECDTERTCGDGGTYNASARCDYFSDCDDGSDEAGCDFFECADGDLLPPDWECDGEVDCEGGEDEANCPTPEMFTCGNGEQVPETFRCDFEVDCEDGSDEAGCASLDLMCT